MAASNIQIQVNSSLVDFTEARPIISDQRVQVPLRAVSEQLGFTVGWDPVQSRLTLAKEEQTLSFIAGSALISSTGRIYVPLRFISESLGYDVKWYDEQKLAVVQAVGETNEPLTKLSTKQASLDLRSEIVAYAQRYLGVPYLWGGTTARGFDCSGFVSFVFNQQAIDLPRTSALMKRYSGSATNSPQPGDLVFFGTNNTTTHVGIYLGDSKFISAVTSSGVSVASLNKPYWNNRYLGAKQIVS